MNYKQIEAIVARWEGTSLLEGVENSQGLALCLETQLRFNQEHESDLTPQFMRNSIPLLRRLFGCETFQRNNVTNFFENEQSQMLFFKTKFQPPKPTEDSLDEEAEYLAKFAEQIMSELDKSFEDKIDSEIIFQGLGLLNPETMLLYYS